MNPIPPYRIGLTGVADKEHMRIVADAIRFEMELSVEEAFRIALDRFRIDPVALGDPLYRIRSMKMNIFNATIPPLYFEYGVHDEMPEVVIRRVVWLADPRRV